MSVIVALINFTFFPPHFSLMLVKTSHWHLSLKHFCFVLLFGQNAKLTMHKVTDGLERDYCHKCTTVMQCDNNHVTGIRKNLMSRLSICAQLCWQCGVFTCKCSYTHTKKSISYVGKLWTWTSGCSGMDCPAAPSCGSPVKCNFSVPPAAPLSSLRPALALQLPCSLSPLPIWYARPLPLPLAPVSRGPAVISVTS